VSPPALLAQSPVWGRLSLQAIPLFTAADPIPGGGDLSEARVVQPLVMVHAGAVENHLAFTGTLDLEGLTIPDGELAPGDWGEGFNDRRHPHTYAHELMLSAQDVLGRLDGGVRLSLSAGTGFATFGTDDPMSRPPVRYPVNHHLAQILERAVAMAGVRAGPVIAEGSIFNGDEPERPDQWPNMDRFGDSWALRLTLLPARQVELQGSRAKVHSPEHRPGAGTDAWKWDVSARFDGPVGQTRLYGLAEWARTEEADGFFVFRSFLLEGAWTLGHHRPYYRFESTDRPEDMRTLDLFRSVRPHLENSILGTTRWNLSTIGYQFTISLARDRLDVAPFAEGTFGTVKKIDGAFDPELFYGSESVRSLSFGLRLSWLLRGHRMGRYGDLLDTEPGMAHMHHGGMP
jgi:hypothetical protein